MPPQLRDTDNRDWLFSGRDIFVKVLAAIAILMLVIAGIATARVKMGAMARNSAWSEMLAASRRGDDASLIRAADRFFAANVQKDSRTPEALHLYEGALLRWFTGLPGQPKSEDLNRLKRYKILAAQFGDGGQI
jgi:hypothetical protein